MTVLRGGLLVDGTGAPPRPADVVIEGGRIAAVGAPGTVADGGDTVDLDGLVLAPGFIDCHTHYDAQVLCDPDPTPSSWHGVTTVVMGNCGFGIVPTRPHNRAVLFDDILPGCYDRTARLADMDRNHTDASLCFPTFPRFCGQTFLERGDRELALACVRAYNDWMIGEWCADEAQGRLIPLTLVPMWDPELAAQEVRRCAAKGSHAIAFSENPAALGLPSVHSDAWDPLWAACEETDTVVNMHIGSSSTFSKTSDAAGHYRAHLRGHVARPGGLADQRCAGPVQLAAHRPVRGPGGLDAVLAGAARRGLGSRPRLREDPGQGAQPAEHLRPGAGLRLRVRRPGRPGSAGPDRHGPDHVRDRLPARRLDVRALEGHGGPDRVQGRTVGAGELAAARGNAISCYRLDRYGLTA